MGNKYYINIKMTENNNAGSKAVNDCNNILKQCGIEPYTLNIKGEGLLGKINKVFEFEKLKKIPENSVLFIQHPIYINKNYYIDVLKNTKKKKNLKLVFLINDLDSLRKMFPESQHIFEHIDETMYEIADYVIAHNSKMKRYLIEHGVEESKIYELGIFDYLTNINPNNKSIRYSKTLNIAGNLDANKSNYIRELNGVDKTINFNLYGLNFDKNVLTSEAIHYKGAFPSDEIPSQLTEGFGLVWDGNTASCCAGNTGEYLKYNNPHKLSLYMVSGLPVVIWSQAAEAEFVKCNNVGLVVDSIEDFSIKFDNLSENDYYKMVENAKNVSYKLRNGEYLRKVIQDIIKDLK